MCRYGEYVLDFAAVLWDLDGTIVDTEPLWMGAETELAVSYGRTWRDEDAFDLIGSDLLTAGAILKSKLGIDDMTPRQIVDYLIARVVAGLQGEITWRPGAVELIRSLADESVPQALVTMSWHEIADPFGKLLPFDTVVSGDQLERGKPHPDPYLLAAERLGVDPADCLAVEDSPTGAASASAAGCRVLTVPHIISIPPGPRRLTVPTLARVTPTALRTLTFDR